jgi:hypothetical protein
MSCVRGGGLLAGLTWHGTVNRCTNSLTSPTVSSCDRTPTLSALHCQPEGPHTYLYRGPQPALRESLGQGRSPRRTCPTSELSSRPETRTLRRVCSGCSTCSGTQPRTRWLCRQGQGWACPQQCAQNRSHQSAGLRKALQGGAVEECDLPTHLRQVPVGVPLRGVLVGQPRQPACECQ